VPAPNFGVGGSNIFHRRRQHRSGHHGGHRFQSCRCCATQRAVCSGLYRFIETSGDAQHLLSTPNPLTLDNEEARIVIGQNASLSPITGGATTASVNPFQTVERKDVGSHAAVKPQISEDATSKAADFRKAAWLTPLTRNSPSGITDQQTLD
jgi:general secretion pathway protein D